ncbi:hypothetical protein O3M35_001971 [Rhynocoris fuscipes]|uniref:Uncharacterized protein n=1 Tax=Rhynocoris fuscipes TaxID=488301 RepID=A0AAW1CPD6_9HEMI
MQKFEQPHYAAIDAIKVIGDGFTIVSGGRDRLINLWKINANTLKAERNFNAIRCHDGWIWDIDSCTPDTFYSSGWDNNVIYWSISSVLERINTFNCGKPVMAISCTNGLVAAGLSTPKIVLIDPRVGQISQIPSDSIRLFDMHKHSITDVLLVPERNLLLSISEDKSMAFFDLRQQKRLSYKTKRISHENSFPRCLSLYRNVVYIGDSRGNVHFYSLESDDILLSPINVGTETRLVTGIVPHMSGITVSTTDGFVRILYPSKPPVFIWQQAFHGEVTAIDQTKHFLVVSTSESNINIFKPIHL